MNERVCRVKKKLALRVGIALGRRVFAFWRHKSCPHPKLRNAIGIDLLLLLIDWCEGGDVQSAKTICVPFGKSPREIVNNWV